MNDEGVYRTSPATPGLLTILHNKYTYHSVKSEFPSPLAELAVFADRGIIQYGLRADFSALNTGVLNFTAVQYSTVQYSTVQYSQVLYSTVPAVPDSSCTVQYSTAPVQYSPPGGISCGGRVDGMFKSCEPHNPGL